MGDGLVVAPGYACTLEARLGQVRTLIIVFGGNGFIVGACCFVVLVTVVVREV